MVTRKRLRSILTTLGLYVMAALLIGYFGVNAYSGNHGLKAKEDLDQKDTMATYTNASFITAGAAALITGGLLFFYRDDVFGRGDDAGD